MTEPLTVEEEAALRRGLGSHNESAGPSHIIERRLLATLDAARAEPASEGLDDIQRYSLEQDEAGVYGMELDPIGRWCLFDEVATPSQDRPA